MNHKSATDSGISDYREFPAPPALGSHVSCFWTQAIVGSHSQYSHRVLPDGCIDMVFVNHDSPAVIGPWTEHFVARLDAGTTIVGARFHPGCAPSLVGVPAAELLNASVPLRDLWSKAARERFTRVAEQPSLTSRIAALANALVSRLGDLAPTDRQVLAAVQLLARHPHIRIDDLGRLLGISNRQLQRRFIAAVGYGPKTLQSVVRFQRLLKLARRTRPARASLVDLSADAGYADQSHMSREVQRFSGSTPAGLLGAAECTLALAEPISAVSARCGEIVLAAPGFPASPPRATPSSRSQTPRHRCVPTTR